MAGAAEVVEVVLDDVIGDVAHATVRRRAAAGASLRIIVGFLLSWSLCEMKRPASAEVAWTPASVSFCSRCDGPKQKAPRSTRRFRGDDVREVGLRGGCAAPCRA